MSDYEPDYDDRCDDEQREADISRAHSADCTEPDTLMDDIQLRVSELILERRKLWDEVQQLKMQRDHLQRLLGDCKAIADGWEDLYRRARQ